MFSGRKPQRQFQKICFLLFIYLVKLFIFYLTDGTKTISTKISQYESKALMDNTAFQSIFVQYGAPIELITLTTAMKWKSEYEYYNYLMRGDITEGMSTVEVMISIGRPDNTITTSHGSRQEVYNNYNGTTYIYYQDNIVTSWSTHR